MQQKQSRLTVSVIIPIYNVASFIERCLDSVRAQDYADIETILIDDCGTDDSMEKVRHYQSLHPDFSCRIISHERNRGLSAARNTGLFHATGDYVYFLDSDDYIPYSGIRNLVEVLENKHYDLVLGDYDLRGDKQGNSDFHMPEGEWIGNDTILKAYADGKWYVMAWNKLCRKDFLTENRLYFEEGLLHEDVIWTFRVACKAQSLYAVPHITYHYYVRKASIMTGLSVEKDIVAYLKAFRCIIDFLRVEHRIYGTAEYKIIEGKKCGLLYSLLEKGEMAVYNTYYKEFYKQAYLSPITAYRKGVITFGYLLRDLHYCIPVYLGRVYKRLFYKVVYAWRGKKIEGAVW